MSQAPTSQPSLLIYNSSAGSGKTYTLVMEFLKLVLQRPTLFRSILAITFTNKATSEMKERIVEALATLAHNTDPGYMTSVCKISNLSDTVVSDRARHTLSMILHDYSSFSVSTIDSFFAKLVRSMSRELQLTFGYNLELDTTAVIEEISDRMFDDLTTDAQLRQWLTEYVMDKVEADKHWTIEGEVHNIARTLFTEQFRTIFPDGDIQPSTQFISSLKTIIDSFHFQLKQYGRTFVDILNQESLMLTDFWHNGAGYASTLCKIAEKGYYPEINLGKRLEEVINNPKKWAKSDSPDKLRIEALGHSDLSPLASDFKNYFDTNFPLFISALSVMEYAYMSGIIGTLDNKLRDLREEENMVMLSDHNLMLRRSMEHNDAEFIYEKTGNRYSHFMLDEFQDTSGFQWENLFPLVHNAIAQGQYTLIVGDPKQSIYRWRGSNMELIRTQVTNDLAAFSSITAKERLSTNFRSLQRVIDFNNRFFQWAPSVFFPSGETPSNGHPYENHEDIHQHAHHGEPGEGFIRFRFLVPETGEGDSGEEAADGSGNEGEEDNSWMDKADRETFDTIRELLSKGFRHRDIAILVRNNDHAKRIAGFLVENGIIRINSPESMQLNRSERVLMLVNLMRLVINPDDKIALAQVLMNNPFTPDSMDINARISKKHGGNLDSLPKAFIDSMTMLKRLPLYEAFERLAVMFGMTAKPDAYLQRFADVLLEFTAKQPVGIADFLEWWEDNQFRESCSVITPSGMDSIHIMTIHKSKGLQFPVVIMPYVSWVAQSDQKSSIWVHSEVEPFDQKPAHIVKVKSTLGQSFFSKDYQQEIMVSRLDNMNLLYVAFTRAEEQLHVFCKNFKANQKPDDKKWSSQASRIINRILKKEQEWSDLLEQDGGFTLEWGTMTGPIKKQKPAGVVPESLREWISEPWQQRIRMLINKDRISSTDKQLPDPTYGIHFHAIAAMTDGTKDADTLVMEYCLSQSVDSDHQLRLKDEIGLFIQTARSKGWFDDQAETRNETELLLENGKILRPDRLILKNNKAIVIDYKTGDEDPAHEKQVREYGTVLSQMGFSETALYLFYPQLSKTLEVAT